MKLKVYETKNYFGLQKEDQVRHKIGYINKNGWLNASDEFKEILSKLNLNWETGNSNGGTKELWKLKMNLDMSQITNISRIGMRGLKRVDYITMNL